MFKRNAQSKAEKKIYDTIGELERLRSQHGSAWTEDEVAAHKLRIDAQYELLDRIYRDEYVAVKAHEPGQASKRKIRKATGRSYYRSDIFGTTRMEFPEPEPMWSSTKTVRFNKPAIAALAAYRDLAKTGVKSGAESERKLAQSLDLMLDMYEELSGALESMDGASGYYTDRA